ncbi:MAG: class II fructose-bisphosphate aldolase [Blautia wexlerae]
MSLCLWLLPTEMFKKAYDGGYAIGAFNVNNMEIVQGITEACQEKHAPVILQVSKGARAYANHTYLVKLVEAAVIEHAPTSPSSCIWTTAPTSRPARACIDGGFTSVMIDASSSPSTENIEMTKKVVEYAHDHGVVVEAELGTLAGIEDEVKVSAEDSSTPIRRRSRSSCQRTGCDSLAIAIGTSHGAYKFTAEQCTRNEQGILVPPPLRFDILEEVSKRLPGFPIVLHGSSSVPQEFVEDDQRQRRQDARCHRHPEEQLRQRRRAVRLQDQHRLRPASGRMTGTIRQFFNEHPDKFDPREYLKPARASIKELVRHKLVDVCDIGSCTPARLNFFRKMPLHIRAEAFLRSYFAGASAGSWLSRPSAAASAAADGAAEGCTGIELGRGGLRSGLHEQAQPRAAQRLPRWLACRACGISADHQRRGQSAEPPSRARSVGSIGVPVRSQDVEQEGIDEGHALRFHSSRRDDGRAQHRRPACRPQSGLAWCSKRSPAHLPGEPSCCMRPICVLRTTSLPFLMLRQDPDDGRFRDDR